MLQPPCTVPVSLLQNINTSSRHWCGFRSRKLRAPFESERMLIIMMMMKKKGSKESLAVMALALLSSASCILPPSREDLNEISVQGERYLDKQIENAIGGVKEMKNVMQKSSEDHKKFLDALEKTKQQKEEAMRAAEEMEAKLEEEGVCNETMKALWEECKPCLKNTCIKYYSRTCSSGSGLVGRQLEDVLNRTSPFSIWINGERIDTLEQEGRRQSKEFRNVEEKYTEMSDEVESIFSDSMKVADHVHPPMFFFPRFLAPVMRRSRSIHTLFHDPFHNFQSLFSPMMGRNLFGSMDAVTDLDSDTPTNQDGSVNEDVIITRPFGSGKMTCREIRRNSAGCIKFRDECEKCKEIQHLDCSGKKPLEGPLKEELEAALAMAERFTQQYNVLLKRFEEQMFNTSSILDLLNKQFGWVSSLASNTQDGIFHVKVVSTGPEVQSGEKEPADTRVSVQLFDSPSMNFTISGDIPWTDPKFSEVVAQEALDRYKKTSVLVK